MEFVKMNESGTTTIDIKELNYLIYLEKILDMMNDQVQYNDWEFWARCQEEISVQTDRLENELEKANELVTS